jgi:26S proteasome regulatory subunit N8
MHVREKVDGLSTFVQRLEEIRAYLKNVSSGRIPINNQILYNLQNIFNMIPNLNVDDLVRSALVKTNDMYLIIYLSSLLRSVIALHGLLNNKIKFRDVDDVLDKNAGVAAAGSSTTKTADVTTKKA